MDQRLIHLPESRANTVPREDLARIAHQLFDLLADVRFNIEHGLPLAVVDSLTAVGKKLAELEPTQCRLVDVAEFRGAVEATRNVEPNSVDRLLRSGERLLASLRIGE